MGHRVIVAADGAALERLRVQFDGIECLRLASYSIRYKAGQSQLWPMIWVALRLPFYNVWEYLWLRRAIRRYSIDFVISDNRYGLWTRQCPCVCITHQLRVIPPKPFDWVEGIVGILLRRWLRRFSDVWVPDCERSPIAGRLSANNGLQNVRYVGLMSRFAGISPTELPEPPYEFDLLVIASGPEPHRHLFIDGAVALAIKLGLRCLIVEGNILNGSVLRGHGLVRFVGHLPDAVFAAAVLYARYLLFRGGYSSIMDMLCLGVTGLMVPTPGQTEQEYLAEYLSSKGLFRVAQQEQLPQLQPEQLLAKHCKPVGNVDLFAAIDDMLR